MAKSELSLRVTALEAEMARIKEQLAKRAAPKKDWLDDWYGAFSNDPIYDEVVRLGREYRESLRPKRSPTPRRQSARSSAGKLRKARQR